MVSLNVCWASLRASGSALPWIAELKLLNSGWPPNLFFTAIVSVEIEIVYLAKMSLVGDFLSILLLPH